MNTTSQAEPFAAGQASTHRREAIPRRLASPDAQVLVAALLAAAAALALTLRAGFLAHSGWLAAQKADLILGPVLVGIYWRARRPSSRFGVMLIGYGLLTVPYIVQSSSRPLLFSVGALWELVIYVATLTLILAFPTGRLGPRDRLLAVAATVIVVLPWFAAALFAPFATVAGSISGCKGACPANAFLIADKPDLVHVLRTIARLGIVAIAFTGAALVCWRFVSSSKPGRRAFALGGPVALAFFLSQGLYHLSVVWPAVPESVGEVSRWLLVGTRSSLWYGFLLALVAAELVAARLMRRLIARSLDQPTLEELQTMLREPLGDKSLQLGFWDRSRGDWVVAGETGLELGAVAGRAITQVDRAGMPAVVIVHDPRLADDPELIHAAATTTLLAFENVQLEQAWTSTLEELRLSRARIARANNVERRYIERELHDGVQQHLLAMRVRLALLDAGAPGSPLADELSELQTGLDEAIATIRAVAHEIYPQLLADHGLVDALGTLSVDTEGAVVVSGTVGRYAPEIETVVYNCCLDGVRAAIGQLSDRQLIAIELRDRPRGGLTFVIHCPGFGRAARDDEMLRSLEDRVGAFSGHIELVRNRDGALTITGSVPTHEAALSPAT